MAADAHIPFVSVVMPVWNGRRFLPDALDSLRRQDPFDGGFEVIAADDGSTDASRELLETASRDLPLRVINGAHKGNWVSSTNKAITEANGEFIAFLHQDDRYRPNRLRTLAEIAGAHPNAEFIVNDTSFISETGRTVGLWRPAMRPGQNDPAAALQALMVQNTVSVPGVIFRREAALSLGLLDETLKYTADWDFWLRLACRHGVFRVNQVLSEFRVHPGSQTVDFARRQKNMRSDMETVVTRYRPELAARLPPRFSARYCRLAHLGVETNLFFGAVSCGAAPQWKTFLRALFRCSPVDWVRYLKLSAVIPRTTARIRAGFLTKR